MSERSREIRLTRRPAGFPELGDFELVETDVADPGPGELLIRNAFVSVDPYMRGRMRDTRSYVRPFALGEPMTGAAVGRVAASRCDGFSAGDWVTHGLGWRESALSDGRGVARVEPGRIPVSAYLGALGMPGLAAYVGLFDIGHPREGETVFVSAAAGAVGSAAGQMAKIAGCRVIGSAGSEKKVAWLRELGFDEAFDCSVATTSGRCSSASARSTELSRAPRAARRRSRGARAARPRRPRARGSRRRRRR